MGFRGFDLFFLGDNESDDLNGKKWNLTVLDASGAQSNKLQQLETDKERELKLNQYYTEKYERLDR